MPRLGTGTLQIARIGDGRPRHRVVVTLRYGHEAGNSIGDTLALMEEFAQLDRLPCTGPLCSRRE